MKKIFSLLLAMSFLTANAYNVEVYNNLLTSNLYYSLITHPNTGANYPRVVSVGSYPAFGGTVPYFSLLGPIQNVQYANPGGYPYNSPGTTPASANITHWVRNISATSPSINTANPLAQSLFGGSYRFTQIKFYFTDALGNLSYNGNFHPEDLENPNPQVRDFAENMSASYFNVNGDIFILFDEF